MNPEDPHARAFADAERRLRLAAELHLERGRLVGYRQDASGFSALRLPIETEVEQEGGEWR
jgi:hypothetical protein